MSDADLDFHQPIALRDGRPALIRVMRPDDEERLKAAFAQLDAQTIYTRFFSFRKELPERAFKRIAEIDFVNLAGLPVAGQRMLAIFVFAVIAWITEAESYEVSSVMLLLFAASWWLGWI